MEANTFESLESRIASQFIIDRLRQCRLAIKRTQSCGQKPQYDGALHLRVRGLFVKRYELTDRLNRAQDASFRSPLKMPAKPEAETASPFERVFRCHEGSEEEKLPQRENRFILARKVVVSLEDYSSYPHDCSLRIFRLEAADASEAAATIAAIVERPVRVFVLLDSSSCLAVAPADLLELLRRKNATSLSRLLTFAVDK